jgi:hypothetical protein
MQARCRLGFERGVDAAICVVELAVVAPNISEVNADRHDNQGMSAWDFRNEVLRRVFHGNSLSPFRKTRSSRGGGGEKFFS